jgi:CubicO group peptidase (beta-lactamase class C family)
MLYGPYVQRPGGGKMQALLHASGGTRWGGGLWINSEDLARFGLLILNHGKWGSRQLVAEKWQKDAVTPSEHGPDYDYSGG